MSKNVSNDDSKVSIKISPIMNASQCKKYKTSLIFKYCFHMLHRVHLTDSSQHKPMNTSAERDNDSNLQPDHQEGLRHKATDAHARDLEEKASTGSPTQVENLEIKPSESIESGASPSLKSHTVRMSSHVSPRPDKRDGSSYGATQLGQASKPAQAPYSRFAEQKGQSESIQRFISTTYQIMEAFEAKVGQKLDALSKRIELLDRRVKLAQSKRKLEFWGDSAGPGTERKKRPKN